MKRTKSAALISSTKAGDIESAKELIEYHGKKFDKWGPGYEVLNATLAGKHRDVALLLIKHNVVCKSSKKVKRHSTPLHLSVLNNDLEIVDELLKKERELIDIDALDENGLTALYLSVDKEFINIAERLVKANANSTIQFTNEHGNDITAFYLALLKKNESLIKLFKPTKDYLLKNDKTLIQVAVENKHSAVVNKLIILNANTRSKYCDEDGNKYPILHLAVRNDDEEMVQTMLQYYEIRTNALDHDGKIPLFVAYERGNVKVMDRLIAKKADVNEMYRTKSGKKHPLLYLAVLDNQVDVVESLLKSKFISINYTDENGKTPFMIAFENRQMEIIKLFVKRKATNVNFQVDEESLLNFAFHKNDIELIELLLKQQRIEVNVVDKNGKTPLLMAYEMKNTKLIRKLIHRGGDVNKVYKDEHHEEYTLLYKTLKEAKKKYEMLAAALLSGENIEDNFIGADGKTPLLLAYDKKNFKIMNVMIKKGANVNRFYPSSADNAESYPLLHTSVKEDDTEMVDLLLSSKTIDINIKDGKGLTPLFIAFQSKNLKMMETLIEKGSNVNLAYSIDDSEYKYTLLYLALRNNDLDACSILLKRENSLHFQGPAKQSPLHLAIEKGYTTIIDNLLNQMLPMSNQDRYHMNLRDFAKYDEILESVYHFVNNHANSTLEMKELFGSFKKRRLSFLIDHYKTSNIIANYSDPRILQIIQELKAENKYPSAHNLFTSAIHQFRPVIVREALQLGLIDANFVDNNRNLAIHIAASSYCLGILLEHGVAVDTMNGRGETALQIAVDRKHVENVSLLLDYDADTTRSVLRFANWQIGEFMFTAENDRHHVSTLLKDTFTNWLLKKYYANLITHDDYYYDHITFFVASQQNQIITNEIDAMKMYIINGTSLTFYHLLKALGNIQKFIGYLRNPQVVSTLEADDWAGSFPIYCNLIKAKYLEAKKRKLLLDELGAFINFELPDICINRILFYLSDKDLQNFIRAYKN